MKPLEMCFELDICLFLGQACCTQDPLVDLSTKLSHRNLIPIPSDKSPFQALGAGGPTPSGQTCRLACEGEVCRPGLPSQNQSLRSGARLSATFWRGMKHPKIDQQCNFMIETHDGNHMILLDHQHRYVQSMIDTYLDV